MRQSKGPIEAWKHPNLEKVAGTLCGEGTRGSPVDEMSAVEAKVAHCDQKREVSSGCDLEAQSPVEAEDVFRQEVAWVQSIQCQDEGCHQG
jgi:hypothetical protein